MKNCVKGLLAIAAAFSLALSLPLFALDYGAARVKAAGADEGETALLGAAYNAYAAADYQSAVMLFRKALSDPQNESDASLYMLIMAEMYSQSYKSALADSEYFLKNYPESKYAPLIKYQQGRSLYFLGEFDKAVLTLSDFCHQNSKSEMYSSALFWIAECFYSGYNFEQARPLYERVVDEFPKAVKAVDAKYRLDAINQRLREEKLLYLLQQTGESYLSSKENYEKALRRYELENAMGLRPSQEETPPQENLAEAAAEEAPSEKSSEVAAESEPKTKARPAVLTSENSADYNFIDALARLKKSAAEAQTLLDEGGKDR
ncbi:MAG: tetratricopeptide repeat protein [Treponema sp.]|nr:tetratricopeptide repeat protein [Treponema sp.]